MVKYICKKCEVNEQEVECNLCREWMCWTCADVKAKNRPFVSKERVPGLIWLCNYGCNGKLEDIMKDTKKIKDRIENELEDEKQRLRDEDKEEMKRKNEELDDLRVKLEKTSKDLEELNDRFEVVLFEEEGLKEEREDLEIDLACADAELQDIKAKCKTAESASRKRDKEHDQLKKEVSQYSAKIQLMSEEEDFQKKINKTLVKQISDLEKINESLEIAASEKSRRDNHTDRMQQNGRQMPRNSGAADRRGEGREDTSESAAHQMKLCTRFASGDICRFGTKCRFVHQRICRNYATEGHCRQGNRCQFSHDLSGRCKREENGECIYWDKCWYGHLWGTHGANVTNQFSRLSDRRHHKMNENAQRYGNHNSGMNDERRSRREPAWEGTYNRNHDSNTRESNYSSVRDEAVAEFSKHLNFLVQQMSSQQNGWAANNLTQRQMPQMTNIQQNQQQMSQVVQPQQPAGIQQSTQHFQQVPIAQAQ